MILVRRSSFIVHRSWKLALIIILTSFFPGNTTLLAQQQFSCKSPESSQNYACGFECFGKMPPEEIASMPIVTISVDFHFVRSNNHQFQCDDPNAPYYAPTYVAQILGLSNDYFTNPDPNQKSPAPVVALTDTRFRVELFGNPTNLCDAIFLHDTEPNSFTNLNAMHIIIKDASKLDNIGGMAGTTKMDLFNIHHHVFTLGWQSVEVWGSTLNHELGHRFGLCHAFAAGNTCPDMDPAAECGGPSATQCEVSEDVFEDCEQVPPGSAYPTSCGDNDCLYCYCTHGTGNNFMGYTFNRRGITPSQWGQMYGAMLEEKPNFIRFEQNCGNSPAQNPLKIPANTIADWDYNRVINQNIEIETGATLIVRCTVFMGKELSIVVNRGARLFVLGGTITNLPSECPWQGVWVLGNPTAEQPDPAIAKDETQMLNPNGAGVVWLNGAILSNAICAVSTRSQGFTDYGGLVMAYASDFVNNGRAVEFMKYGKKNKSYFSYVDVYKSGSPEWAINKGISIWGCHGIKFLETHFNKIAQYGVLGIDFSAELENCSVKEGIGLSYGFKTESTMPNIAQSSTIIKNCQFEKLGYGVYASSTPNMIYPLTITDGCRFSDGNTSASWGVRIAGESNFKIIKENTFDDHLFSVHTISTGNISNEIACNYFESFIQRGINTVNNNSNLVILGNQFINPSGIEITVSGTSGQQGKIASQQGSSSKEAGNCFDNPTSAISAPASLASFFRYYVYDLNNNPVPCRKPTNNLFDGGTNNYTLLPSTQPRTSADCEEQLTEPPLGESDLNTARQNTVIKKTAWLANPHSGQASEEYYEAVKWQEYVLHTLVRNACEAENPEYAEYLLLGENTNTARRWVVGMRTQRGNIPGAQALLNSMIDENQDDVWFKDIMAINFAIAQSESPVQYQLSAQQEATLHTIANTHHSIMQGYACALLSFCKDYTCTDQDLLQEMGITIQEHDQQKPVTTNDMVRVFPNPSAGQWTLECPQFKGETLRLELLNIAGKTVATRKFTNTGSLSFEEALPEGIYFLRLFYNGLAFHSTRLILAD